MKSKMKSTRMPAAEMAELLGRSEERVRQLVRDGTLPPPARGGLYDPVVTLIAWARYLETRLAEKSDGGKSRVVAARAALLEHRLQVERGDFIPAEEVRRDVTRAFGELKGQLLIIPRRVGQELALESDPVAVEERVNAELVSVLDSASRAMKALGARE